MKETLISLTETTSNSPICTNINVYDQNTQYKVLFYCETMFEKGS